MPSGVVLFDNAGNAQLPAAAALSDTAGNPTTPIVGAAGMVWDGTQWKRASDCTGAFAAGQILRPILAAGLIVSDGTGGRMVASPAQVGDGGNQQIASVIGYVYNGANCDRPRSASAANVAANSGAGVALVARPGNWSQVHSPAANTVASASRAAGAAGVRHVCTTISVGFAAGATAPAAINVAVNLRDGATGAGTILWSKTISLPATAGASAGFDLTGLSIEGSAATAMTLEFSAAGGANTIESVTLMGYDVS